MISEHHKHDRVGLSPITCAAPTSAPSNHACTRTSHVTPAHKSESRGRSGATSNRKNQHCSPTWLIGIAHSTQSRLVHSPMDEQRGYSTKDPSDRPALNFGRVPVTTSQEGYESLAYPTKIENTRDLQLSRISSWNAQTALAVNEHGNDRTSANLPLQSPYVSPIYGNNEASATRQDPQRTLITSCRSADRNLQRDRLLVQLRDTGMPYSRIKELLGFTVQLSTLRGRYRSLTKPRSQRVRKPVWTQNDVMTTSFLNEVTE